MFISPDHPHCDACASPNSGQEVALIHEGSIEAAGCWLVGGETMLSDDVTIRYTLCCRGCLAGIWKPGDAVAPLQREFDRFTVPTSPEGVGRWNVLDQMLAEAYWQGWSARSERGFVATPA